MVTHRSAIQASAAERSPGRVVGVAMSMLNEDAAGTSCNVDPGLKVASAAPNTTDTTSGSHRDKRTLGLCKAKEQERRPKSSKKLSPNKLAHT